ncbi:MAG: methionine gamma-lyase family protein, partial [Lachnospiraceae bacterium]|nr:methionine gamma-lyase family protein [Lachnospiraceae bacterium]
MIRKIYEDLGISREVYDFTERIAESLSERFKRIDRTAEYNQMKVISAMQKNRLAEAHFQPSTGYGYNDQGRDALEAVYSDVFHTESSLVRPSLTCGTHALTIALSANVRPGDEIFSPVGKPYDTLEGVIGIKEQKGSLKEYGVTYAQADLLPDGSFDYDAIRSKINSRTKLVTIQRSKGYDPRPTFSV